ncbi:hypothetical protein [Mesorhizobium sp. J8]|uniref:hypothetical protein n=1 Tax=Mesorhizobium sp. J8 TaxID=2777475 RepID=UPI0019158076|nr:hypothetical protein [Mesorhizobium sp. J8]
MKVVFSTMIHGSTAKAGDAMTRNSVTRRQEAVVLRMQVIAVRFAAVWLARVVIKEDIFVAFLLYGSSTRLRARHRAATGGAAGDVRNPDFCGS